MPSTGVDDATPSSTPFDSVITPSAKVSPGRVGTPAPSQRIRFVPTEVVLPGGDHAPVVPAGTVNDQLQVPSGPRRVGWWDGGAEAGDPFGSIVLAGHVDTKTEGLGFFARLRKAEPGEYVVLRAPGRTATYRISSKVSVPKDALATRSGAFDQTGGHRLVLITCTGAYDADNGGYEDNLVVTATAVGLAK
ncbi:class F sortase [Kribbella sp. NBC_01505]|uniref:class F sortase n=1 Tax=Kribbella sp. NBC_01505 TaxID=2903580 RepID=UPI003864F376